MLTDVMRRCAIGITPPLAVEFKIAGDGLSALDDYRAE
jgi:hypothetical protein